MFISTNLTISRGTTNSEASNLCIAQHFYTTTDTLSEVTTNGYFPPNFGNGLDTELIKDSDLIIVYSSSDISFQMYNLSNVMDNPVLGNLVTIQEYVNPFHESTIGGSYPFTGPYGNTQITLGAIKFGRLVIMFMGGNSGSSTTNTFFQSSTPVFDSNFYPAVMFNHPITIEDGNVTKTGNFSMDTNGNVAVQTLSAGGNFDNAGTCGIFPEYIPFYTA